MPCPGNLALWLEVGPFAGCERTCWLKVSLLLTEVDCSGVGVLSLGLSSANRGKSGCYVCIFAVMLRNHCTHRRRGIVSWGSSLTLASWSEVFPSSLVDFPLNVHHVGPGTLCWLRPV